MLLQMGQTISRPGAVQHRANNHSMFHTIPHSSHPLPSSSTLHSSSMPHLPRMRAGLCSPALLGVAQLAPERPCECMLAVCPRHFMYADKLSSVPKPVGLQVKLGTGGGKDHVQCWTQDGIMHS